jgi:hypothetical protein
MSGHAHTADERLAALAETQAHVADATDSAATRMERFSNDVERAKRTFVDAVQEEVTATRALDTGIGDLSGRFGSLNDIAHGLGTRLAAEFSIATHGVGTFVDVMGGAVHVIERLSHGDTAGALAALQAAGASFRSDAGGVAQGFRDMINGRAAPAAREEAPEELANGTGSGWQSFAENDNGQQGRTAEERRAARRSDLNREGIENASQMGRRILGRAAERRGRGGARRGSSESNTDRKADAEFEYHIRELAAEENNQRESANQDFLDSQVLRQRALDDQRERKTAIATDRASRSLERKQGIAQAEHDDNPVTRIGESLRSYGDTAKTAADSVVDAFGKMTDAASAHFDAFASGRETAGEALKGFVSDTLSSLAKLAAQKAVFSLAEGFFDLFTNPAKSVADFAAAGIYTAFAVGAGAASAAMAPSSAPSGGRAAPVSASDIGPGSRQSGSSDSKGITVVFSGTVVGTGGMAQAGHQIAQAINEGNRQYGTQLAPGVLQQAA